MKIAGKIIIPFLLLVSFFLTPLSAQIQPVAQELTGSTPLSFSVSLQVNEAHAQLYADCSDIDIACHFKNAIIEIFEIFWYRITQVLAALTGYVLDFILSLSIASQTYRSGIIEAGWEILRDFSNIIFIFALLIIAFNLVLGNDKANVKSLLVKTVLVALVINFSLFATYLVVDASNLIAHTFYNRIDVVGKNTVNSDSDIINTFFSDNDTKSVSLAIISQFNPQRLMTASPPSGFIERLFLIVIAGVLNAFLIYLFVIISLLFIGRIVGLMLLGIFAPVAFGTLTLPNATSISWIGFNTWWKQLLSLAFTAPIFIFLMYLTVMFATNTDILSSMQTAKDTGNFLVNALNIILPFAIIGVLLTTSLKVTKKLAGELGNITIDAIKKGIGGTITAGAVALTGGAALAGGGLRALGFGLSAAGKEGSGISRFGKRTSSIGKGLQAQNFNFGSNKYVKQFGKFAGVDTTMGIGDRSLSYSNVDIAARRAGNRVRGAYDDLRTGRTLDSVEGWQNKVQESRDKLSKRQLENAGRQGEENVSGQDKHIDFATGTTVSNATTDVKQSIEDLKVELATRSAAETQQERDNVKTFKKKNEGTVQELRNEIKYSQERRKKLVDTGNVGAIRALDQGIKAKQDKIRGLEKDIKDIEESTLEGRIKNLEKQLETAKKGAQGERLKKDIDNAWTNSGKDKAREQAIRFNAREQAIRFNDKKIKLDGDTKPDNKKSNNNKAA